MSNNSSQTTNYSTVHVTNSDEVSTNLTTESNTNPIPITRSFIDKNANKYQQIDARLLDAIALVLQNEEFINSVGDVIDNKGETLSFSEVIQAEDSVFQRMLTGQVSYQTVKDFIYLVMRMSERYNTRTVDVHEYLSNNEVISILFDSTDLDPSDFQPTLRLIPNPKSHRRGRISQDGRRVMMSIYNVYTYTTEKDGFRIFSNERGKCKYVIDGAIYTSNQLTTIRRVDGGTKRVANDLGQFMRNSLTLYHEDSLILTPDVTFKMIKDLPGVNDIIHAIHEMKDGFDRARIPTLPRLMTNPNRTLRISIDDFRPKCFTNIIEDYRDTVDDLVVDYFTRYLQTEEDHDFIRKILNPKEKEVYQHLVDKHNQS